MPKITHDVDEAEKAGMLGEDILMNDIVESFAWDSINVVVKDRATKKPKSILSSIRGHVRAGEIMALMGPSGSGKTTLLNVLAHRAAAATADIHGSIFVNGRDLPLSTFRRLSSYVEQEDTLIGSLTVKETLSFAARLALPSSFSASHRERLISTLIQYFGLQDQKDTIIGTPIQKGISGGQKRRVSAASALITGPKILFLDEFTSGLDSVASYEAVSCVKRFAKANNIIVIASIHQPSTTTFKLFDKLLLLSNGKTCYNGPTSNVADFFHSVGYAMPTMMNPAEFILDLVNVDFQSDREQAAKELAFLQDRWRQSMPAVKVRQDVESSLRSSREVYAEQDSRSFKDGLRIPFILLHRSFIKSYRDVFAYGIRLAMYTGLAIMMGTVWLRLETTQASIQPFINGLFFGSAFLSFMAVAYVPAFLEDRSTFVKERANGLYGATAFTVSNFLIGVPYLFLITLLFSIITYWLSNFQPTAQAFFTWIMWLFLDLLAAESLVVLISSLFPIFVVALALTAFANGLWMSVGGFLVTPQVLNVFWRYVFHYIDYQAYVFQGMMVNEFAHREYDCGSGCQCMFQTELAPQCKIAGQGVLDVYGYSQGNTVKWVGILLAITFVYRVLGWFVLWIKKT